MTLDKMTDEYSAFQMELKANAVKTLQDWLRFVFVESGIHTAKGWGHVLGHNPHIIDRISNGEEDITPRDLWSLYSILDEHNNHNLRVASNGSRLAWESWQRIKNIETSNIDGRQPNHAWTPMKAVVQESINNIGNFVHCIDGDLAMKMLHDFGVTVTDVICKDQR